MKRITIALLLAALLCALLAGCGARDEAAETQQVTRLRFSDAMALAQIEGLAGKPVEIVGYMATISPVSGQFIYLLNLPYQNCPFCVPNTAELANTIAVYAREGAAFGYTEQAVLVKGRMEIGDYEDEYGYTYNYRIIDATYEEFDLSNVSSDYALWYAIAEDGIVAEINAMFNYLLFVCQWTEYMSGYEDEAGAWVEYHLSPADAAHILQDTGPYGLAPYSAQAYFPALAARAHALGDGELADLAQIIAEARALADEARAALDDGRYTYDEAADKYALVEGDYLLDEFNAVYWRFAQWVGKWAL